jgi:amino acid transporter
VEGYNILPKPTSEEELETINKQIEEIWFVKPWSLNTLLNNLDSQTGCCIHSQSWIYIIIRCIAISFLLYLIILFAFFWYYKYKKDKQPFKQALKKARLWGIIVSIVVFGVFFLISYYK